MKDKKARTGKEKAKSPKKQKSTKPVSIKTAIKAGPEETWPP